MNEGYRTILHSSAPSYRRRSRGNAGRERQSDTGSTPGLGSKKLERRRVEGRGKPASYSVLSPNEACQVFAAPMSLKSTPPLALSSFADSTMVIVTALGSTL